MTVTVQLKDASGAPYNLALESNAGVLTPHSVPEVAGAPVTSSNPMPVTGAVTQSGGWSVSLSGALPAGSNAIGQVQPVAGTAISRSVTTVAATSTQLMPANASRRQFWFQAPQSAGVWINRLGGTAGPNLTDCTYWPAGSYYETGNAVSTQAVTYYCATAGLILSAGEI